MNLKKWLLSSDNIIINFGASELKCDEMKEAISLVDEWTNEIA